MKTKEETIHTVFARRDAYNARAEKTAFRLRVAAFFCCVCLLAVGIAGAAMMKGGKGLKPIGKTYCLILDVNPSIGIDVENGEVVNVEALNSDAKEVVKDTDFSNLSPEETVEILTDRLTDLGYLSAEANSMLISVKSDDPELFAEVAPSLSKAVTAAMQAENLEAALLVQSVPTDNAELNEIAENYGISAGKAQLIAQILVQDAFLNYDELAPLTVQELNVLRMSLCIEAAIQCTGSANLYSYIGEDRAKEICLADAQTEETAVAELTVTFDCYNGSIIYLVEFESVLNAYRYRVNAVTSEILSSEISDVEHTAFFEGDAPVIVIGENAALTTALEHAGMSNANLIRCKTQRDWVNRIIYKLSFSDGLYSCNYTLDAKTGEILKFGKTAEPRDFSLKETVIGEAAAKAVALAHGGLVEGNVSKYEMKLIGTENGLVYALTYLCDGCRSTATVDAATGDLLSYAKEVLTETGAPSTEAEAPAVTPAEAD